MGKKGFTLIELIALILLVAILSFIAITKFSLNPARLTNARIKLMSDIRYVQALAIGRGATFGIEFNTTNESYSLYEGTPATKIKDPLDPDSDFTVNYPVSREFRGVDIASANFDGSQRLEFDWQGVPHSGGGSALSSEGSVVLQIGASSTNVRIATQTGRAFY